MYVYCGEDSIRDRICQKYEEDHIIVTNSLTLNEIFKYEGEVGDVPEYNSGLMNGGNKYLRNRHNEEG